LVGEVRRDSEGVRTLQGEMTNGLLWQKNVLAEKRWNEG